MGGYVSLDIALRGTGRVRGLALVNTSAIAAPEDKRQNSLGLIDMIGSGGFEQAADLVSGAVAPHRPDVVETAGSMVAPSAPTCCRINSWPFSTVVTAAPNWTRSMCPP